MTPHETYAQKRDEAIELIRAHAPARLQDALIALLRPAIALSATRANDDEIPIGASKFGGAPDVPEGFEWPTWNEWSLGFLAQINLEEVAPFDIENLLPKSGLISFFYEMEEMPWGGDAEDEGSWHVCFWENMRLQRQKAPVNISDTNRNFVPSCSISGGPEWTTPDSWELRTLGTQDHDFESHFGRNQNIHRMFGHTNNIQDPVIEIQEMRRLGVKNYRESEEIIKQGARDWSLLFQVDSDEQFPTMWGDGGMLYFTIRNDDLAARRFERTRFDLQCG